MRCCSASMFIYGQFRERIFYDLIRGIFIFEWDYLFFMNYEFIKY